MHKPSGDLERLKAALAPEIGCEINDLDCDFHVLKKLQPILAQGQMAGHSRRL